MQPTSPASEPSSATPSSSSSSIRCFSTGSVESDSCSSSSTTAAFLPSDLAVGLPIRSPSKVCNDWNLLSERRYDAHLKKGGCLYYFTFLKGTAMPAFAMRMCKSLVNLSSFSDEERLNNAPFIDTECPKVRSQHVFLLNKAIYLLPQSVSLRDISKELIASKVYQGNCQPKNVSVHECSSPDTFRITKPIIWPVFSLTMQFKVSVVDPSLHEALAELQDGVPVHFALLLERTKRTIQGSDSIKKVKSILLYHELDEGGIVVTNVTTGVATSVPGILASIIDKLGSMGAKDVSETAERTRAFFKHRK